MSINMCWCSCIISMSWKYDRQCEMTEAVFVVPSDVIISFIKMACLTFGCEIVILSMVIKSNSRMWKIYQTHYGDVILSAMAFQFTGVQIVCSTVCSGADKENNKAPRHCPLWGNPLTKGTVTRKMFPFDRIIMLCVFDYFEISGNLLPAIKWYFIHSIPLLNNRNMGPLFTNTD